MHSIVFWFNINESVYWLIYQFATCIQGHSFCQVHTITKHFQTKKTTQPVLQEQRVRLMSIIQQHGTHWQCSLCVSLLPNVQFNFKQYQLTFSRENISNANIYAPAVHLHTHRLFSIAVTTLWQSILSGREQVNSWTKREKNKLSLPLGWSDSCMGSTDIIFSKSSQIWKKKKK